MAKVTQAEFARRHNKTKQYISKLVRQGDLIIDEGLIDTNQGDPVMKDKSNKCLRTNVGQLNSDSASLLQDQILKARAKAEIHRANILEAKDKKIRGEYVDKKKIEKEYAKKARVVRDHILNIPDRIANQLVSISEVQVVHSILTTELELALEELSSRDV